MSGEPEIRYLGDLQRIDQKPGDIFVLTAPGPISADAALRLRKILRAALGDESVKVLVLEDGMKLGLVSIVAAKDFPE